MKGKTVVFDICLPNNDECHEFSYLDMIQKRLVINNECNGVQDPIACQNDSEEKRLAELAKSFERKYGTMVTMKKSGGSKRVRIDDFLDLGEGYDTQDSFIDDSEAVDVFVAPNVTTKFGGFFVHEGIVEGLEDHYLKIETPVGSKQPNASVVSRPVKKNKSKELLEKAVKRLSTSKVKSSPGLNKTNMNHLDSLFDEVLAEPVTKPNPPESNVRTSVQNVPETVQALPKEEEKVQVEPPPLPSDLPNTVEKAISRIINLTQSFSPQKRRLLGKPLDVELLSLMSALTSCKLPPSSRSAIFSHLEAKLHWKRKSLNRRLRKLQSADEDQKLNPLLDTLADAISRAMPAILDSYTRDKEVYLQRMKAWQAEARVNESDGSSDKALNNGINDNPAITNDSSGNVSNPVPIPNPSDNTSSKRLPKPGAPKKIFRWNNECRKLFEEVVTRRLESYHILNAKGPREEFLRLMFPTLMQLWPDGWITNAALWRAALPTFHRFNNATTGQTISGSKKVNTASASSVSQVSSCTQVLPVVTTASQSAKPGSSILPDQPIVCVKPIDTVPTSLLGTILSVQSKAHVVNSTPSTSTIHFAQPSPKRANKSMLTNVPNRSLGSNLKGEVVNNQNSKQISPPIIAVSGSHSTNRSSVSPGTASEINQVRLNVRVAPTTSPISAVNTTCSSASKTSISSTRGSNPRPSFSPQSTSSGGHSPVDSISALTTLIQHSNLPGRIGSQQSTASGRTNSSVVTVSQRTMPHIAANTRIDQIYVDRLQSLNGFPVATHSNSVTPNVQLTLPRKQTSTTHPSLPSQGGTTPGYGSPNVGTNSTVNYAKLNRPAVPQTYSSKIGATVAPQTNHYQPTFSNTGRFPLGSISTSVTSAPMLVQNTPPPAHQQQHQHAQYKQYSDAVHPFVQHPHAVSSNKAPQMNSGFQRNG